MSCKMTKFKDLLVDTPNRYTVNGEVKTIVFAPNAVTQEGTKDKAEYFNEMQKNGLYNVNATRVVEGTVEFYDIAIEGSDIFDVFDTQFIINFNETNTKLNPVLRFNGNNYYIRALENFIDSDIQIGSLNKTYIAFLDSTNNKVKLFNYERKLIFDTVSESQSSTWLVEGDTVEFLGYYEKGDGGGHKRTVSSIDNGTGIAIGNLFANIENIKDRVTLLELGAKGDGVTDDTLSLQKANYCKNIDILEGYTYYITSIIRLTSNKNFYGNSTFLFNTTSNDKLFYGVNINNITFKRVKFKATSTATLGVSAIKLISSKNILCYKCETEDCNLFWCDTSDDSYTNAITDEGLESFNLNSDLTFIKNNIKGAGVRNSSLAGIDIRYSIRNFISKNYIKNTTHGIQFWGGNSAPGVNGAIANERKCKDIIITDNIIKNVQGGGIWGSMGIDGSISNNTVEYCGDVGIDPEGCFNISVSNNNIKHCSNGCLSSFYYNLEVIYIGNTVYQDGTIGDCLFLSKDSTNGITAQISIIGNVFKYGGSNFGNIKFESKYIAELKNNKLINTKIIHISTNCGGINIEGNNFLFTNAMISGDYAIQISRVVGARISSIKNNKINLTSTSTSDSYGIMASQEYFNGSVKTEIENNKIDGWTNSICIDGGSSNTGISNTYFIKNNILSGVILYLCVGFWRDLIILENNLKIDGSFHPNSIPTNGKFKRGQKIFYDSVSSTGYEGLICTVAGYSCTNSWVGSKAYSLGQYVYSGSNVYYCSVSGTSSTVAPTHTSGTATDGTVTWTYVGVLAIWKGFGLIQA